MNGIDCAGKLVTTQADAWAENGAARIRDTDKVDVKPKWVVLNTVGRGNACSLIQGP